MSSQFTKSVIRSRAALTYAEAQSRIDDARLTDELSVRRLGWGRLGWWWLRVLVCSTHCGGVEGGAAGLLEAQ